MKRTLDVVLTADTSLIELCAAVFVLVTITVVHLNSAAAMRAGSAAVRSDRPSGEALAPVELVLPDRPAVKHQSNSSACRDKICSFGLCSTLR